MTDQNATRATKLQTSSDKITGYCGEHSVRFSAAQLFLIEKTMKEESMSVMLFSADEMQLLTNLCIAIGAKKTIDIGVYTGYSALSVAEALPADGKVLALDITDEYLKDYNEPAWRMAGIRDKIEFKKGPANESLRALLEAGEAGTFDFICIDADKTGYDEYYELSLQLLRKGGIVAFDNMLWGGKVLDNSTPDPETKALQNLAQKLHKDGRVRVSLLRIGDGVALAFKN